MALPVVPNVALGKVAEYAQLAKDKPTGFTNAGLLWILLKTAGLEADTALRDYADLATLLGATNDESTFTGYSRLAVAAANIAVTPSAPSDNQSVDITVDPSWNPTTAEATGAIILAFDPDTTTGTDSSIIPIFIDAIGVTTGTGGAATPLTYQVASGGFVVCTQA